MNSRPFTRSTQKSFRPAFDYLTNLSRSAAQAPRDDKRKQSDSYVARRHHSTSSSLDDTDHSDVEQYAEMEGTRRSHSTQNSRSELQPAVQLIDISSRSTSPYPRSRNAAQSEDEDEDDYEPAAGIRPLGGYGGGRGGHSWRAVLEQDGLGGFLFGTRTGWQLWVGLLVFWAGGCGFGLLLMNRFIMLTGVYKFPFPLTGTYVQLILTHAMLVTFSSLTRGLGSLLRKLGFGAAVAPAIPVAPQGGAFRSGGSKQLTVLQTARWLCSGFGGIAGGGLFEFDYHVAKQVLPLAVVFVVKVLLSNFSFAYAPLPVYQLARIGVTPLAIIFSCILQKESHSAATLSSALIATLNLFFATLRSNVRVTWESIVAGAFSSLFVALYPIMLLRTYRTILASLVPPGDLLTAYPSSADEVGNKEETRAYYRILHYTSLLSLMILTPIVLLSGELGAIYHNIPFLDVPFFWFMIWCGALGSFAVFSSMLLVVKATSPLTATFIQIPRSAFQLVMLSMFKMPAHSWIGVVLCWISSAWFVIAKRNEMRSKGGLTLEGR